MKTHRKTLSLPKLRRKSSTEITVETFLRSSASSKKSSLPPALAKVLHSINDSHVPKFHEIELMPRRKTPQDRPRQRNLLSSMVDCGRKSMRKLSVQEYEQYYPLKHMVKDRYKSVERKPGRQIGRWATHKLTFNQPDWDFAIETLIKREKRFIGVNSASESQSPACYTRRSTPLHSTRALH
mmetsp:Transcript_2007/g.4523  ORF Transcript_2007/g.4523 Transcript_2007/m.4523 type:complete len:182 (-) Transcript_2007:5019-5564(-)